MKTLTSTGLNKMAMIYKNSLSHVLYKLDGIEKQTDFFKIEVIDNVVTAYIFFDENAIGTISEVRVIDKDGDTVAEDKKVYARVVEKALYIVFKHEFVEV